MRTSDTRHDPIRLAAIALLCIAGIGGTASAATAQSLAPLQSVEVALWPEYDRPAVLVIYRIDLAPNSTLPARVEIEIPVGAGEPNAVAQMNSGNLVTVPYERTVDGAMARISLEATQRQIQIEYYDPALTRDGTRREFTYRWPATQAVEELVVAVQEPPETSAFLINPPATETTRGSEGLLYDWVRFGTIGAGQTTNLSFGYDRVGDQLTVELLRPSTPAAPPNESTPAAGDGEVAWLLIIGVVLIVAAAAVAAFQLVRRSASSGGGERGGGGGRFCTHCGAAASAADRFCSGCGKQLRRG